MSALPLVSIICLCYNHERFLQEALDSVLTQTYPNIEIIVVDDCSTDNSISLIEAYLKKHPQIKFISTRENVGNCAAFNKGWKASNGQFIIDFATDDVLLPDRVAQQVSAFQGLDQTYGVVYSDAEYITDSGAHLHYHSQKYKAAANGDVFAELLRRYFICPPTMMMRRTVFEKLNGYDATLAYEDFDFWLRSSRIYKYHYLDKITTKRRIHNHSLSRGLYNKGNKLLASTVVVCQKAATMVEDTTEKEALVTRLKYEVRHAFLTENFKETGDLLQLLETTDKLSVSCRVLSFLNTLQFRLGFLRKWYHYIVG